MGLSGSCCGDMGTSCPPLDGCRVGLGFPGNTWERRVEADASHLGDPSPCSKTRGMKQVDTALDALTQPLPCPGLPGNSGAQQMGTGETPAPLGPSANDWRPGQVVVKGQLWVSMAAPPRLVIRQRQLAACWSRDFILWAHMAWGHLEQDGGADQLATLMAKASDQN